MNNTINDLYDELKKSVNINDKKIILAKINNLRKLQNTGKVILIEEQNKKAEIEANKIITTFITNGLIKIMKEIIK